VIENTSPGRTSPLIFADGIQFYTYFMGTSIKLCCHTTHAVAPKIGIKLNAISHMAIFFAMQNNVMFVTSG